MSDKVKLLKLNARRVLLLSRARENRNIVRKIERQMRAIQTA